VPELSSTTANFPINLYRYPKPVLLPRLTAIYRKSIPLGSNRQAKDQDRWLPSALLGLVLFFPLILLGVSNHGNGVDPHIGESSRPMQPNNFEVHEPTIPLATPDGVLICVLTPATHLRGIGIG